MTVIPDAELARKLWALGDPVRLRLLRLLPVDPSCATGSNVSALAETLGLAQPTVSHHLRVLRQAGFIEGRKMCRDVFYHVVVDHADTVLAQMRTVLMEASSAVAKTDGRVKAAKAAEPAPAVPKGAARKAEVKASAPAQPAPRKTR